MSTSAPTITHPPSHHHIPRTLPIPPHDLTTITLVAGKAAFLPGAATRAHHGDSDTTTKAMKDDEQKRR
jgi:hypothetical protein